MLFSFIIQCPQCNKLLLNEHGDEEALLCAFIDNFSSGDLVLIFRDHAKQHAAEPDATIHSIAAMFDSSFESERP
jgi:hypothetical protein